MVRQERSLSSQAAWAEAIAARTNDHAQETVAEAFAVVGLPHLSPLQPLMPVGGDEPVLSNVCLVSASEVKPEGFEVLTETPCGQRAVLSSGGGVSVYLAQCLRPQRQCSRSSSGRPRGTPTAAFAAAAAVVPPHLDDAVY